MIRVISIGTDKNIFNPYSAATKRMVEYGSIFGELHVIVFTDQIDGLEPYALSSNVFVYPTKSIGKMKCIIDAIRIGKMIGSRVYFGQTVLSVQDPFETGIVGVVLKRKFKFPLQIQIHTDFYSRGFYDGTLLNWVRFEISRFVIPRGDAFRVVREKIASDLSEHYKIKQSKILTLPIWVDIVGIQSKLVTVNLRNKYKQFNGIILSISRLAEEKNIDLIIKAFGKVSKKFPQAGLVILGSGPEGFKLQNLVKKLDLTQRVIFEDWQQDPISYMKTADLFVNASRFEGYGMTIIEAAAAECPILTTKVGVVEDIFEDHKDAYICNTADEQCFVNNMISFLENPRFQSGVTKSALEKVKALAITKEEYLNLYKVAVEKTLMK